MPANYIKEKEWRNIYVFMEQGDLYTKNKQAGF